MDCSFYQSSLQTCHALRDQVLGDNRLSLTNQRPGEKNRPNNRQTHLALCGRASDRLGGLCTGTGIRIQQASTQIERHDTI